MVVIGDVTAKRTWKFDQTSSDEDAPSNRVSISMTVDDEPSTSAGHKGALSLAVSLSLLGFVFFYAMLCFVESKSRPNSLLLFGLIIVSAVIGVISFIGIFLNRETRGIWAACFLVNAISCGIAYKVLNNVLYVS